MAGSNDRLWLVLPVWIRPQLGPEGGEKQTFHLGHIGLR